MEQRGDAIHQEEGRTQCLAVSPPLAYGMHAAGGRAGGPGPQDTRPPACGPGDGSGTPLIGCGFILGWNFISLLAEFLSLSRVYQHVLQPAVKSQQQAGGRFLESQQEAVNLRGNANSEAAFGCFPLLCVSPISSFHSLCLSVISTLSANCLETVRNEKARAVLLVAQFTGLISLVGVGWGCRVSSGRVRTAHPQGLHSEGPRPEGHPHRPVQNATCTAYPAVPGADWSLLSLGSTLPQDAKLETAA